MNMSIMVTGGNSPMTHFVRTCTTLKNTRTIGNLTTTIPTILWYCNVVIHYIFCHLTNGLLELRHFEGLTFKG